MKIEYHCIEKQNNSELCNILIQQNIKMFNMSNGIDVIFDFYSDTPMADKILEIINRSEKPFLIRSAIYSAKEMKEAQWYSINATMLAIDTRKVEFTYSYPCPYDGDENRYYHQKQVNPFVANRMPKWKHRYNFCGVENGDTHKIFCSSQAKSILMERGLSGVEYMPVLKGDMVTQQDNIYQLVFPNILAKEAIEFVGEYNEIKCPICGRVSYEFSEPNMDNWRVKTELIPPGIDAFTTELSLDYGDSQEIVISKKLYNILIEEMKEKHLACKPVG